MIWPLLFGDILSAAPSSECKSISGDGWDFWVSAFLVYMVIINSLCCWVLKNSKKVWSNFLALLYFIYKLPWYTAVLFCTLYSIVSKEKLLSARMTNLNDQFEWPICESTAQQNCSHTVLHRKRHSFSSNCYGEQSVMCMFDQAWWWIINSGLHWKRWQPKVICHFARVMRSERNEDVHILGNICVTDYAAFLGFHWLFY